MRNYFNAKEKTSHIIIMAMQHIVEEMTSCGAVTEQEKKWLNKCAELIEKFNDSAFERFGDSYRRKIKNTLDINTLKLVSKFGKQAEAISECATEDLVPCINALMVECVGCEKCDYKNCAIYNIGVACDINGHTQSGCPYRESLGDIDL